MKKFLFTLLSIYLMTLSTLTYSRTVYIHLNNSIPKDVKLGIGYYACYTNDCRMPTENKVTHVTKKNEYETLKLDIPDDQSIIMWGIANEGKTTEYWAWGDDHSYTDPSNPLNACNTFHNNSVTFVVNNKSPLKLSCIAGTD